MVVCRMFDGCVRDVSDMSYGCCRFVLLIVWGCFQVVCMLLYVWLVDAFGIWGDAFVMFSVGCMGLPCMMWGCETDIFGMCCCCFMGCFVGWIVAALG